MTQSELAKKIGITTSSIGMYETGTRKPSYEVLYKLSEALEVSIDFLLGSIVDDPSSKVNTNFDKGSFAKILEKAKGERTINEFAKDTGISAPYISRLIRKLIDNMPTPESINIFAQHALNNVAYEDLMDAAGYKEENKPVTADNKLLDLERTFFQIIASELYTCKFEWSINKPSSILFPDIIVDIKNGQFSKWYIEFKSNLTAQNLSSVYGQIALLEFIPDMKFSIAVNSDAAFNILLSTPPRSLKVNLYAMLININERRIVKEEKLCHI